MTDAGSHREQKLRKKRETCIPKQWTRPRRTPRWPVDAGGRVHPELLDKRWGGWR